MTEHHTDFFVQMITGTAEAVRDTVLALGPACANWRDLQLSTALSWAAFKNKEAAFYALLEYGADIHAENLQKQTPLHAAAMSGAVGIARTLLALDARIDACDEEGQTPLMLAAHNGHHDMVAFLISQGATVAQRNHKGQTAEDYARRRADRELTGYLGGLRVIFDVNSGLARKMEVEKLRLRPPGMEQRYG